MATADEVLESVGELGLAFRRLTADRGFDPAQTSFLRGRRLALGSARQRFDEKFDVAERPDFADICQAAKDAKAVADALPPEDGPVNAFGRLITDLVGKLDRAVAKPTASVAALREALDG